ncbi:MAG: phosphate propanoyltransferase [Actinobacteria bacterium]|nr:phosphate propanoyltransferase [Actinomycetota bacterium]
MDTERLVRDIVTDVISEMEAGVSGDLNVSGPVRMMSDKKTVGKPGLLQRKIVCGVSVRHIHLCKEHVDVLFGKGYEIRTIKELYQLGTYAYKETVTVIGPRMNAIQNVKVFGPLRDSTQVELAKTDCIILDIDAPVRPSGQLAGTASAVVIGPEGAVYLEDGVIRANRHIHLSPVDAEYFGVKDNNAVDVRVPGTKGLTFNNVQVRVSPDFKSEMHVDTDDGNASDIVDGTLVEIVDVSHISPISLQTADGSGTTPQTQDNSFTGDTTDPNILKSINDIIIDTASKAAGPPVKQSGIIQKKTIITACDLDDYRTSGIEVSENVILSPLARDEALEKGIKISYRE